MTTPAAASTAPRFLEIPREQLHPSPFNPMDRWQNPDPELAASVKAQGIIEPLIVRVRPQGGYEIIAGHRRWAAAVLAGLKAVPVIVRTFATAAAAAEVQLVENEQREDLTAIERAQLYASYLQVTGKKQDELAAAIGRTPAHVSQVLSLLALPKRAVKMLEQGKLDFTRARELGRLVQFPKRLDEILDGIGFGDYPDADSLKQAVKYELEDEARENKRLKEEQAAQEKAAAARVKAKSDKKAQKRATAERAAAAKRQAAEIVRNAKREAERARLDTIHKDYFPKVLEARAPALAKQVRALRDKLKIPDAVATWAEEQLCHSGDFGWGPNTTTYEWRLREPILAQLPGKWQGRFTRAKDVAAARSYLAFGAWIALQTKGLDKELLAAAEAAYDQAQKAKALNARKAPARKGGRK